jgi:hypothetical protein
VSYLCPSALAFSPFAPSAHISCVVLCCGLGCAPPTHFDSLSDFLTSVCRVICPFFGGVLLQFGGANSTDYVVSVLCVALWMYLRYDEANNGSLTSRAALQMSVAASASSDSTSTAAAAASASVVGSGEAGGAAEDTTHPKSS